MPEVKGERLPRVILPWMPLYTGPLLGSDEYKFMKDFQQAWYLNLLMRAWENTTNPVYLENDPGLLSRRANAQTERFFLKNANSVLACFRVSEDGLWLYNKKQVEVYEEQLRVYWSKNSSKLRKSLRINESGNSCASLCLDSDSVSKVLDSNPLIDIQQATTKVCIELGISGMENRAIVKETVAAYIQREKVPPDIAADSLVELRLRYEKQVTGYQEHAVNFFARGTWRNPLNWGKNGTDRQATSSKQAERFSNNLATSARERELLGLGVNPGSGQCEDRVDAGIPKGLARGAS